MLQASVPRNRQAKTSSFSKVQSARGTSLVVHSLSFHGTLLNVTWQSGWVGSLGENGSMYVYGCVPLLSN